MILLDLVVRCSYYIPHVFMQAFQKGSSLEVDISRATLKAIESGEVQKLEEKMLSTMNCGSTDTKIQNERLGPQPFFGLFGICGAIATFSLLVTIFRFVESNTQKFKKYIELVEGSFLQIGTQVINLIVQKHRNKYITSDPALDSNRQVGNVYANNEQGTISTETPLNYHS